MEKNNKPDFMEIANKYYRMTNLVTPSNYLKAIYEAVYETIDFCANNLFNGTNVFGDNKFIISKDDVLNLKKIIIPNNEKETEQLKEYINEIINENTDEVKFNPIGLLPKKFHDIKVKQKRFSDICDAISRYYEEGLKIPVEWIHEYNETIEFFKENNMKKV